jgi:hypothetical protein
LTRDLFLREQLETGCRLPKYILQLKKITTGVSEIYFLEYFLEIPEIYVPT